METSQGIARVRLLLDPPRAIDPDEQVSFRMNSGGGIPISVVDAFDVERWDGQDWVGVQRQERPSEESARSVLAPGDSTDVQVWPDRRSDDRTIEPGWYRIVKSAWVGDADGTERELLARGRFKVRAENWSAPPEDQEEGIVRRETEAGVAALELLVEHRHVTPDGHVSIRLVNRGRVTLSTGYGFEVDRWDGRTWVRVPFPENTLIFDVEVLLRPGQSTDSKMGGPERWPGQRGDGESIEAGWYRVAKFAVVEGGDRNEPDVELVARALFHVAPRP